MTKKEIKANAAVEGYNTIKEHLTGDKRIVAKIESVSRSGMSRKIKFYGKDFYDLTDAVARLADYPIRGGCVYVSGCGMDMVFSVLTNVNYAAMNIDGVSKSASPDKGYAGYFVDAGHYELI